MNVLMTGGTGFIGSKLVEKLTNEGHQVYILTRNPEKYQDNAYISYISYNYPMKRLPFIHAVVNLAGESIFGYWSTDKKERIITSRINITEKLIRRLQQMETKPNVFLSGSAIGYYGMSDSVIYTEETRTAGDDFLAKVCEKWETAALEAQDVGVRTVLARFGVVLHDKEGALPMMALPVNMFVGGKIGNGNQWISWIHWQDCVNLLYMALTNNHVEGPINITAPHPVTNKDFIKTLAKVKKRPALVPTPHIFFKIAFAGMHQLITEGQYVLPKKAQAHHYSFQYEHVDDAFKQIYK